MAKHALPEGYVEHDVDARGADVEPQAAEIDDETRDEAAPDDAGDDDTGDGATPTRRPWTHLRQATVAGLVVVLVLGGLTGWLGYQAWQAHHAEQQRERFVEAGRQSALRLTSVDWQRADADVQSILDSATGKFYDQFEQRAQPYTEVVKQAQSKSTGTIQQAALESVSESGDSAKVLVAVTIAASNAGAAELPRQFWRMRLTVQEVDGQMKVSEVDFVQ